VKIMAAAFRLVLVEPEYEINLGAVARLAGNFGIGKIYLVNPKCEVGFTAKMHAKHAAGLLENAAICKSVKEAIEGCKMAVGTSWVVKRHKKIIRSPITPPQFASRLEKSKFSGEIAVLFGREGIGLSSDELEMCDALVCIPTSEEYPVMNLSHAVAVVLYAFCAEGREIESSKEPVDEEEYQALLDTIGLLVGRQAAYLKNRAKSYLAFKTVIGRAVPSVVEVRCMLGVLRRTLADIESLEKRKKA